MTDRVVHRYPPELLAGLHRVRDRVLDGASLAIGDTVLDVGCGDGLIGFGALERTGDRGGVIFSDLSAELVGRCKATADDLGFAEHCRFVVAPATNLTERLRGARPSRMSGGCRVTTLRSVAFA